MNDKDYLRLKELLANYNVSLIRENSDISIKMDIENMNPENEVEKIIIDNYKDFSNELCVNYDKLGIVSDGYKISDDKKAVIFINVKKINKLKLMLMLNTIVKKYK